MGDTIYYPSLNYDTDDNKFYSQTRLDNKSTDSQTKKTCSQVGPIYADTISTDPIFTGSCKHLGNCKVPIKATTTPHGTRGIPLTGSYNRPGFMLTRAFRMSHAVKYNKSKTVFVSSGLNHNNKRYGHPNGSGSGYIPNKLF